MKKIKCNSCGKEVFTFGEINECVYCFYEDLAISNITDDEINEKFITHLLLTYNKTGENILMNKGRKFILGRKNFGNEVLRNEHISGSHCSIEIKENEIYVEDLGSTNGTFYMKKDEDHRILDRQRLEDGELLFLGKESFLIGFIYDIKNKNVIIENTIEGQIKFKEATNSVCPHCGYNKLSDKAIYCPDCKTKL
jgi:pSer/pThr/pTyr-binding forkhead associated (FHA) protein